MRFSLNPPKKVFKKLPKASKLNDAQICALVMGLELHMDSCESAVMANADKSVKDIISLHKTISGESDEVVAKRMNSNKDVAKMCNGSVDIFRGIIAARAEAAEEGFVKDLADSSFYLSIFGFIPALLNLSHHTLKYLKGAMDNLEEKVYSIDNSLFRGAIRMNLSSKYLPDFKKFVISVEALERLANYLTTVDPKAYSIKKAMECLAGSVFTAKGKSNADKGTAKDVTISIINLLPFALGKAGVPLPRKVYNDLIFGQVLIRWAGFADETADIRDRGWNSKKAFEDGFDLTKRLIAVMEKVTAYLEKLKGVKDEEQAKYIKPIAHWCKFVLREAGFLARGYVVAANKASSSVLGRIARGLVD